MTLGAGDALPDEALGCRLLDADGNDTTLAATLPPGRPSLLIFVRQFVCAGCSERAAELLAHHVVLETAGVAVTVIGCGTPGHAKEFDERLALGTRAVRLVTDPTLAIHRAMGLVRSHWGALGPIGTFHLLRAMARGHHNRWGHGDFYQMGGTFLLDEHRRVIAAHTEEHLGATLPLGDVVNRALVLFARRSPEVPLP